MSRPYSFSSLATRFLISAASAGEDFMLWKTIFKDPSAVTLGTADLTLATIELPFGLKTATLALRMKFLEPVVRSPVFLLWQSDLKRYANHNNGRDSESLSLPFALRSMISRIVFFVGREDFENARGFS